MHVAPSQLAPLREASEVWRPVDVQTDSHWDSNLDCMQYEVKVQRYPEIFRESYDPRELESTKPDPAWVRDFQDAFGDEARQVPPKVFLALHPWFKRWCGWEWFLSKEGTGPVCRPFIVFSEEPREGYLPPDYDNAGKRHEELRGQIGDYCIPCRVDMERYIGKYDKFRTTKVQRARAACEDQERKEAETNAVMRDRDGDFASKMYVMHTWRSRTSGVPDSLHLEGLERPLHGRTVYWLHLREDGSTRMKEKVRIGSLRWDALVGQFCEQHGLDEFRRAQIAADPRTAETNAETLKRLLGRIEPDEATHREIEREYTADPRSIFSDGRA